MRGLSAVFLCLLFVGYNEVKGSTRLSVDEDLELEKQLRLRNKPAVKTIQTDYGDIYDCVDFFKQPAFDHPLLKNHTYHYKMKPRFLSENRKIVTPEIGGESVRIGLKESCPVGTVPIKRTTKEDLIREKLLARRRLDYDGGSKVAIALTLLNHTINFTGAEGFISLHNPGDCKGHQYSASRIRLSNAEEFIEFGWRVDENLYNDVLTHQYIATKTGFDVSTGFVLMSPHIAPGLPFAKDQISTKGHIKQIKQTVRMDKDGDWWLELGPDNRLAGFLPGKLFTKMTQYADFVNFGGEVYSPPGILSPIMGTGNVVFGDYNDDAFIQRIRVTDTSGDDSDPETEGFENDVLEYGVEDTVLWGRRIDRRFAHIVYFGGRGDLHNHKSVN